MSKPKERTTREGSEFGSEFEDFSANNFEETMLRFQDAVGSTKYSDLAAVLGISAQSVHGVKKRKRIPDSWYLILADKSGVSIDWLRTGDGEMRRSLKFKPAALPNQDIDPTVGSGGFVDLVAGSSAGQERKAGSANNESDFGLGDVENFDIGEVLAQTIDILNSKTVYTTAIVSNIKAFHKAITTEKKIDDMQNRLDQTLSDFQDRLNKIHAEYEEIRAENQQLRDEVHSLRSQHPMENTG